MSKSLIIGLSVVALAMLGPVTASAQIAVNTADDPNATQTAPKKSWLEPWNEDQQPKAKPAKKAAATGDAASEKKKGLLQPWHDEAQPSKPIKTAKAKPDAPKKSAFGNLRLQSWKEADPEAGQDNQAH